MSDITVDLPLIRGGSVFPPVIGLPKPMIVGSVSLRELSGELEDPILHDTNGNTFFSPSFSVPNVNNIIHIQSVTETADTGDEYKGLQKQRPINQRPFILGPALSSGRAYPPDFSVSYSPSFNQNYSFVGTQQNNARGTLVDTMTLDTTMIFY